MNDRIPQSGTHSESVPVLISEAGPVGLVMSIFLSRLGIQNMVVEKRERIYTETLAGEIVGTMSTDAMKPGDVTLDLIARREQAGTATLVQEPQTAR